MRAFLAKGADPNATDKGGGPALIWAVARGQADVVRILIEAAVDVSRTDRDGLTAVELARRKNRTEILEILRVAGAGCGPGPIPSNRKVL